MATKRDQRILIGYTYDATGEKAFLAAVNRQIAATKAQTNTADTLNAVLNEGYRIGLSAADALGILEKQSLGAATAQERIESSVEGTTAALKEQAAQAGRTASAITGTPAAGRSNQPNSRIEGIDRFGTTGSQIAGALGGSELGNIAGLIGDSANAFAMLGPAGIAATGAIAGLTIGIGILNEGTRDAVRNLQAAAQAQDRYYAALGELTTEQATEQIAAIERSNALIAQQLAEGRAAIDANISGLGFGLVDLGATIGIDALEAINEYRSQLDALQAEYEANQQTIVRLTQGVEANVFANNDAAEAAQLVADAERELADARRAALEANGQTILNLIDLSQQELQARIAEINIRRAALQEIIATGGILDSDTLAVLQGELATLNTQLTIAQTVVAPFADTEAELTARRREGEAAALALAEAEARKARQEQLVADTRNKFVDSLKAVAAAREDEREAQVALTQAQRAAADRIRVIEAQQLQERQQKLEEFAINATRAEQDLRDDLLKIQRDAGDDMADARGNRDALSFALAKRQADRQLQDAQSQAQKEQQRARENFNRQLQLADRANQQRLAQERAAASAEINTRAQALGAINQRLQQAIQTQNAIYDVGFAQAVSKAKAFTDNVNSQFSFLLARLTATKGGGNPSFIKNAPAGAPVVVNIAGASTRTIQATSKAQTLATLNDLMQKAGYR